MGTRKKLIAEDGFESNSDLIVNGDVSISGHLNVLGEMIVVDSTTISVGDSMFELANSNTSTDLVDIGIYGIYNDGLSDGVSEHTGLFRDASDSTWKLFDGLEVEPSTTVNVSGSGFAYADFKAGDIESTGKVTATNVNPNIITLGIGYFNGSDGSDISSSGISCARNNTGEYTISFSNERSGSNYVIQSQVVGNAKIIVVENSQSTNSFQLKILDDSGSTIDRDFYVNVLDLV